MSELPRPAVKAFIQRQGKILALKTETEDDSYWVLPGGKVEYGESPTDALKREIKEELSTEIDIGEPVGMYHFFTGPENNGAQIVLTAFDCNIKGQEIDISSNPADENITESRWLTAEEFIEKTSNDSLVELIRKYQK